MENKKHYYIRRGIYRPVVFTVELKSTGTTEEDFNNKEFVVITKQQADFYTGHPTASFSEIMDMEINPVVIVEIPIEERYKQRVKALIAERYSLEDEIRILYNGSSDPRFSEHETFVSQVKLQVKQELGYE